MTQREADERLDFEALRLGIERCDPDLILGLYAHDAQLSIVNAGVPETSRFELRGKAEIAKHLRAAFGQVASHRVAWDEVVDEGDGVRFQETCEYPDGGRVVVETTLEVRSGKIVRQVDLVTRHASVKSEGEIGQGQPYRTSQPPTRTGADAPSDRRQRPRQVDEKEELR